MIPKFKTYLNESVWGDLRKKSLGQEIRKEDTINNLSPKEMYNHLKTIYKPLTSTNAFEYTASGTSHYVRVNITKNCTLDAWYEVKKETTLEIKIWFAFFNVEERVKEMNKEMTEELKRRYRVKEESYVFIRPKTGKKTNDLIIDVIDFILSKTKDKPIIERI